MTERLSLVGLVDLAIAYLPLKLIRSLLIGELPLSIPQLIYQSLQAKCTQKLSTKQDWW
jgi:hypothetical protein